MPKQKKPQATLKDAATIKPLGNFSTKESYSKFVEAPPPKPVKNHFQRLKLPPLLKEPIKPKVLVPAPIKEESASNPIREALSPSLKRLPTSKVPLIRLPADDRGA